MLQAARNYIRYIQSSLRSRVQPRLATFRQELIELNFIAKDFFLLEGSPFIMSQEAHSCQIRQVAILTKQI